jgi:hypothetical protein
MSQAHHDWLDEQDAHVNGLGDDNRLPTSGPKNGMSIPQHVLQARANRRPKVASHGKNTAGKAH